MNGLTLTKIIASCRGLDAQEKEKQKNLEEEAFKKG